MQAHTCCTSLLAQALPCTGSPSTHQLPHMHMCPAHPAVPSLQPEPPGIANSLADVAGISSHTGTHAHCSCQPFGAHRYPRLLDSPRAELGWSLSQLLLHPGQGGPQGEQAAGDKPRWQLGTKMLTGLWVLSPTARGKKGHSGGHNHLQCEGYPHIPTHSWVLQAAFLAEEEVFLQEVFLTASLTPGPLSPCTPGPQPATSTPTGTSSPDLSTRCPPPPWAALSMLLTLSLWDHGCPLGPVMPTALEMHPQRPTKTRILPGT